MCFFFVKSPLGDELSAQVLNLLSKAALDGIYLFAHYGAPDAVELVKNLRDTGLGH
jgi:hypothetical protein